MVRRAAMRVVSLCVTIGSLLMAQGATAQTAGPGDVYYKVHVDQRFKYYVFPSDTVTWANADLEGVTLSSTADHDSTLLYGVVEVSSTLDADAGTLSADFDTHIGLDARTGIWHQLFNTLSVQVYVKGHTGTPWHVRVLGDGQLDVSRFGGLPGSLQGVNGTSTASFMDSTATIDSTGAVSVVVDELEVYGGNSTTEITVGADVYSYAGTYVLGASALVTQAVCILGCMTAPATFGAHAVGHAQLDVYLTDPTGVADVPVSPASLALSISPNPVTAAAATIAFRAPAGRKAQVQLFDVAGRLLAQLYEGAASGRMQQVSWADEGLPAGVYFLRVHSGAEASTRKLTLMR